MTFEDDFGDGVSEAKPKVVIVDDDPLVLMALRVILSKTYDVQCLNDAVSGVAAAAEDDVALVILDVKMPEYDGFWAFRKIRENGSDVPIIFNSAYQDSILPEEISAHYKPYAYLGKNGDVRDFLKNVEGAIEEGTSKKAK